MKLHPKGGARAMTLKIPPVLLALLAGVLIGRSPSLSPAVMTASPIRLTVASGLALAGAVICGLAVAHFRRARTTVNPLTPEQTSALVVSGVYRYSRNPMYLGFALILLGWAVFRAAWPGLVVVAAFVGYLNRFQIRPEEQALAARFGASFEAYRHSVPRWL